MCDNFRRNHFHTIVHKIIFFFYIQESNSGQIKPQPKFSCPLKETCAQKSNTISLSLSLHDKNTISVSLKSQTAFHTTWDFLENQIYNIISFSPKFNWICYRTPKSIQPCNFLPDSEETGDALGECIYT